MEKKINNLTSSNIKYLLVMKKLYEDGKDIRSTDIAKALNITKPSVHTKINALQTMNLVKKDYYGIVCFTNRGKELADRYTMYFKTVLKQLCTFLPMKADTCSAACAVLSELSEDEIKTMCENINTETKD